MERNVDLQFRYLMDKSFPSEEILLRYRFQRVSVKKNFVLLNAGDVCRYAFFICKGCLRAFFVNENKEEKTRAIAFENRFISASASFITKAPSLEYLQALEHTELLRIRRDDLYDLIQTNEFFNKLYIHSLEQSQVFGSWRIEIMMNMTAKERYVELLARMPEIFLRLSNKQVASFLGITQESLSRLKAIKAKDKKCFV
jgi:CRP-like cAMP-binding protein